MKITKEKNKRVKRKKEERGEMKSDLLSLFLIYTFFVSSLEAYKIF
jgi:hypothetical protein